MVNILQICYHEASHGIVAECVGLTDYDHIFVDLVTPQIDRRGGIDIDIEDLKNKFDSSVSVPEKRPLALRIIAVFAAGRIGEEVTSFEPDPDWSSLDDRLIEIFAIHGIMEDVDLDVLNTSQDRDNGWLKWNEVDRLKEEGRQLARASLLANVSWIQNVAQVLYAAVRFSNQGHIERTQLLDLKPTQ
jgi:hypothetical protein